MRVGYIFTNRYFRFLVPFIIFWLFWFFVRPNFSNMQKRADESRCETEQEVKSQKIIGVVVSKYTDERKLRYINYLYGKSIYKSKIFVLEGSETYNHIQVGDSIKKLPGSLEIKRIRSGMEESYLLYYGCE
jgi:hypothetical protein